jgi:hypothetical protein
MEILHSNQELFAGFHYRAVKQGECVKIQQLYKAEGSRYKRYKTVATLDLWSYKSLTCNRDMTSCATLHKIACYCTGRRVC